MHGIFFVSAIASANFPIHHHSKRLETMVFLKIQSYPNNNHNVESIGYVKFVKYSTIRAGLNIFP